MRIRHSSTLGPSRNDRSCLDREGLLARSCHDDKFLAEMSDLLKEDYSKYRGILVEALDDGNLTVLDDAIHGLKNLLGNFTTRGAFETLKEMEADVERAELRTMHMFLDDLHVQVAVLIADLEAFLQERQGRADALADQGE